MNSSAFPVPLVKEMIPVRSFGASSAHKGLWLAQKMTPDTLNHALTMWDVDGELDPAVMESTFLRVMGEAEVLRVTFAEDDGDVRMTPRELGDWRPFLLDLSAEPDPEQAARDALAKMVREPFDLERDLLFRLGVVRLAADRSLVVIAYHHLISDGYGAGGPLSRRLAEVYTALVRGAEVPEPAHPWDAGSFAALGTDYLASEQFTEDTEFWRDYLKDAPPPARVPRVVLDDAARSALDAPLSRADRWSEVAGAIGMVSRTLTVPRAEADRWTQAAQSLGVWMSTLLTAAAAVYFRHRCDQPEFLLSLAVGNRNGAAATTPGLAVNVVPLRVRVPLGATFGEIADAVVDETYEVFGRTACHYSDIQRASGTVLSGRGSFGAVVNVVEFVERLHFGDSPARYFAGTTGCFDELSIGVCTDGSPDGDLVIRLEAPEGLYSRAELRFVGEELLACVRAAVAAGERPVGALDVAGGTGRERMPVAPDTAGEPLPGLTVPELFARRVERAPDAVALVSGQTEVTYRELDERAGRVAAALRRRGVGPESVVAVALPRSVDLVVALLGVVKAGGAYLPLDPGAPAERLAAAAGGPVRALLTDAAPADPLPADPDVPVLLLDGLRADPPGTASGTASDAGPREPFPAHPDGLLAVLPGSGPAGATTAVAVTHRNLERLVLDRRWRDGDHRVLWHAPHTSDAFALEVWMPLLGGGRVVVAEQEEPTVDALAEARAAHGISATWLPAGLLSAVAVERPGAVAGLREVWTGGDRVSAAAVRRVREACPELAILRGHGPTEAGGFAAGQLLAADGPGQDAAAVGRPMDHTALYVLGPGLAPVPAGVVGELYVAGPGVARGYRGRPGPTAEHFVPCPFGPPGGLMLRTGDRVRWSADGRLEQVGRAGVRARVRGVEVEPAEVEAELSRCAGLAQAVVAVRADDAGQQRLVAYAVPLDTRAGLSEEELSRFVTGRLPEAMVPSAFVVLERLPTTADGRVDHAALPDPEVGAGQYRAPRDTTERVLAKAFADVLDRPRVGIDEDFFDLGGNSLRAIRLVGLIRAELKHEVSIRTLFAARTIMGLSSMWEDLSRSSRPALRKRTRDGEVL